MVTQCVGRRVWSSVQGDPAPGLEDEVGAPFALVIDWAEEQLRALGCRDARDLAFSLLVRIQGAALPAQSFRDTQILAREARLIDHWIDDLA